MCYALDHRRVIRVNSGGLLSRQMEVSEYSNAAEQCDVETAYVLANEHALTRWSTVVSHLRDRMRLDNSMSRFARANVLCATAYVADCRSDLIACGNDSGGSSIETMTPKNAWSFERCDMKHRLTVSQFATDYIAARGVGGGVVDDDNSNAGNDRGDFDALCAVLTSLRKRALQRGDIMEHVLVPLLLTFSVAFVQGLAQACSATAADSYLPVTCTYTLPRDEALLLRHYDEAATAPRVGSLRCDSLLMLRHNGKRQPSLYYENIKLRQRSTCWCPVHSISCTPGNARWRRFGVTRLYWCTDIATCRIGTFRATTRSWNSACWI